MKTIAMVATAMFMTVGAAAYAQPAGSAAATGVQPGTLEDRHESETTADPADAAGPNAPTTTTTEETTETASGDQASTTGDDSASDPTPTARATVSEPWMSRAGAAVMVGGGWEDFTNSNIRGMTEGGGSWTARVVAGTRQLFGLEAAYVGAARGISGVGLGNDANLVSNGVEGALRANLPIEFGRSMVEPFAFVGLGWQHYSLMDRPAINVSAVSNSDDVMTLPYGAGVEFSYGMFIADARFTYRYTFLNDLMRVGGGRLSTYGVTGQVGIEF